MKKTLFLSLAVGMFLMSCDGPSVYFSEPQPAGVNDLKHFPIKIQGNYTLEDFPVRIEADAIVTKELVADTIILGDSFTDEQLEKFLMMKGIGLQDQARYALHSDTLIFRMPEEQRLVIGEDLTVRKWRKMLFLNIKEEGKGFTTVILKSVGEHDLQLMVDDPSQVVGFDATASDTTEIKMYDKLGEFTKIDTLSEDLWNIQPNRKELRNLINEGYFVSEEGMILKRVQ